MRWEQLIIDDPHVAWYWRHQGASLYLNRFLLMSSFLNARWALGLRDVSTPMLLRLWTFADVLDENLSSRRNSIEAELRRRGEV